MLGVIYLELRVIVTIIDATIFFYFLSTFRISIDFSGGFRFFIQPSKEALPCESE